MNIPIPAFSLVILIGPPGAGKSTFARRHFTNTQVVSSDQCRELVNDNARDQSATGQAYEILHAIVRARLRNRRLTVVDATNLRHEHRAGLLEMAREHDCQATAIVFDMPRAHLHQTNRNRPDSPLPNHVMRRNIDLMRDTARSLRREPFRRTHFLKSPEEAAQATVSITPMRFDRTDLNGPFDIIGDVHGCHHELTRLMWGMGYRFTSSPDGMRAHHPAGRIAVFVGDLVDRGPAADRVLELVANMMDDGAALCVIGNHEEKLLRTLKGNPTEPTHGLARTIAQLARRDDAFRERARQFIQRLPHHLMLDRGRLAVAHAGILEEYQGRHSGRIGEFCLYGETTGERDHWGLPVRLNWARNYHGRTLVVHGHAAIAEPTWTNNSINIDTGCCFGGQLTAYRYPEGQLVSVPALRQYYAPVKTPAEETTPDPEPATAQPMAAAVLNETTPPALKSNLLSLPDILDTREVNTALRGPVRIRPEQAAAALEIVSRHTIDPRWLIYVPPTMSPCDTKADSAYLETLESSFDHYERAGVNEVICQEKHMGSRAVAIIGRTPEALQSRFGLPAPNGGICYTRSGRNFFTDPAHETAFIHSLHQAVTRAGLWDELDADWLLMDAEITPWSYKAMDLLREQYAATGAAARSNLHAVQESLRRAAARGLDVGELVTTAQTRYEAAHQYTRAYGHYCWDVSGPEDLRIAPFHFLAAGDRVFTDRDHTWHMDLAQRLHAASPELVQPTQHRHVNLADHDQRTEASNWWLALTAAGAEGAVVKPLQFVQQTKGRLVQPAIKCRGPQYLRITYGPEYDLPQNLNRLRSRNLRGKRNAALNQFALGVEGLNRFVTREPFSTVHHCAFAVLALETDPGDPRL